MSRVFHLIVYLSLAFLSSDVNCYKVLIVYPIPAPSHYILGNALAKGLAKAGLEVTMVSPFIEKNPPKNYKSISLTDMSDYVRETFESNVNPYDWEHKPPFIEPSVLTYIVPQVIDKFFAHPKVQSLVEDKNETFDAVIIEEFFGDSLKVLAYHFKAPLILVSSMQANKRVNSLVGNPEPPSYVPDIFLPYNSEMSFYQRTVNFLFGIFNLLAMHLYQYPAHNSIVKKYFPSAPSLEKFQYNVSLLLVNAHESFNEPVPSVPNMVNIGGYHVDPPKELPSDLKKKMDDAKDGVIYFSLGSNLEPSKMPNETLDAILKALGSRKEKVLWKWDQQDMPNKPANFEISKWFPQQDILAHPNVKLFITHCGLLSTIETIYHGVPILGFPVFGDQKLNARRAATLGFGKYLPFSAINERDLKETLKEVLDNPKYRENAKRRSRIIHDRPVKPLDLAVYWVKYVIRHKGAPHLRVAGVDLPLYKYLMLDVLALIFCVMFTFVYIIYRMFKYFKNRKSTSKLKQS